MLTSGKTPFAVGGETAIRRVGRVAECTSPLTRQAVRLRRFESSTLRNFISGYGTDYYRKPRCIGHTRKKCREYRDRGYNLRHRTAVYRNAHRRFGVHRLPPDCGESGEIRDRKLRAASCAVFPASRRHRSGTYPRSEEPHRGACRRARETLFVRSHQAQKREENQGR